MRERLVAALAGELLGPRNGPYEVLHRSPLFEYMTGILAPRTMQPDRLEAEAELAGDTDRTEDTEDDVPLAAYDVFSPILNPQSLPHSIGITFTVVSSRPSLEICATWGMYRQQEGRWLRRPYYMLTGRVVAMGEYIWSPDSLASRNPSLTNATGISVRLHLISRRQEQGRWRISVFLTNEADTSGSGKPDAEACLFQPQIRVLCCEGTELAPGFDVLIPLSEEGPEDASLRLLFHNRRVMARGHLCAAVWNVEGNDVDPERPCPDHSAEQRRPRGAPFFWVDADVVPPEERDRFRRPTVRTEFIPSYSVPMPDLDWPSNCQPQPHLDAGYLAESWDPVRLREALAPLVDGYRRWLESQEARRYILPQDLRSIADRHLDMCRQTLNRMTDAIGMLEQNEAVRLAFCFANKAMALQYEWTRNEVFRWRPFQMGFILTVLPSIVDPTREDREVCDLLWVATAAGKTEAYLGLVAFALALRRLRARSRPASQERTGAGVAVISRYTLRLLTIQQFRRTLGIVTACEVLRVWGLGTAQPVGWRPQNCPRTDSWLWGSSRFSVGLWVGGGVTPNRLFDDVYWDGRQQVRVANALGLLQGQSGDAGQNREPAQVLNCPFCRSVLAVPERGLSAGTHRLFLVCSSERSIPTAPPPDRISTNEIQVLRAEVRPHNSPRGGRRYWTLVVQFSCQQVLSAESVDRWWAETLAPALPGARLECARASRPGYFIRRFALAARPAEFPVDFDIYCPNVERCPLNERLWAEGVPATGMWSSTLPAPPDGQRWMPVSPPFRHPHDMCLGTRIPIPALTVDDQVYHRCPSVVVATADKFARLPFEPKAASLFGNVDSFHVMYGYYRQGLPPDDGRNRPSRPIRHPRPEKDGRGGQAVSLWCHVPPFDPPEFILQDELHLIDGPLGSLVGLYEAAVDEMASRTGRPCKYIASSATVRHAAAQVQAVYNRRVSVFPPPALRDEDSFFVRYHEEHPLETSRAGRLYVGVCTPGRGAQTPIVRIWSKLLQKVYEEWRSGAAENMLDPYWTLTGYFNAIRELAGARSLYQQDIRERIREIAEGDPRPLELPVELSSRMPPSDLPSVLDQLNVSLPNRPPDAVLTTSMFGVGVDIPRLGLMVVHGQPKRTSDYIQATGRIGRRSPGLVVTFYRATRPRDLSHYEFFVAYHSMLHRFVEPITVFPFAPGVRARALGPVAVSMLRCALAIAGCPVDPAWKMEQRISGGLVSQAPLMADRRLAPEVQALVGVLANRVQVQPEGRRPSTDSVRQEIEAALDAWHLVARRVNQSLAYWEYRPGGRPIYDVVLGDLWHERSGREVVYANAPQSLRDVEETIGIEV